MGLCRFWFVVGRHPVRDLVPCPVTCRCDILGGPMEAGGPSDDTHPHGFPSGSDEVYGKTPERTDATMIQECRRSFEPPVDPWDISKFVTYLVDASNATTRLLSSIGSERSFCPHSPFFTNPHKNEYHDGPASDERHAPPGPEESGGRSQDWNYHPGSAL